MRILLAEPDAASRDALQQTLAQWGYDVVAAVDGGTAWEALQSPQAPRLALLAVELPTMAGVEVCRRARERKAPYVYLVLLSERTREEDAAAAFEAGADEFLGKPFEDYELKARLRTGRRILDLQEALLDAQAAYWFEAKHDSLTAVWNRPAIFDLLRQELARGVREATPVGVVVLEIDGFRGINESRGHAAGDAVLRETVKRMGAVVRPYDGIGRYGTEEFLVILPGCDAAKAASLAERIRESMAARAVQLPEAAVPATVRLGVTASGDVVNSRPEALIGAASAAVARAAKAGGNRVEIALAGDIPGERAGP